MGWKLFGEVFFVFNVFMWFFYGNVKEDFKEFFEEIFLEICLRLFKGILYWDFFWNMLMIDDFMEFLWGFFEGDRKMILKNFFK